ncbi:MAG: type III pantothenate kinase [Gammaproteobacteria bacterium]|nr:type III pantothenate kinase [Gammaproteobacteria bacterium]
MILLIDIGNSDVKCALLQGGRVVSSSRCRDTMSEAGFDWPIEIPARPDAIYLISVGSEQIEQLLMAECCVHWGLTPVKLHTSTQCAGITNGYNHPLSLGVDRWAAMIGAYQLVAAALLVIDCGTACTADIVDSDGRHLGGAIMPGLQLMRQSLRAGVARIDAVDNLNLLPGLGCSTSQCIHLGVTEALLGFIERMERIAMAQVGAGLAVVITGGGAVELLPHLQGHIRYERDLIFLGMTAMVMEERDGAAS